jgi:oxygen-dependent protoporphyrinogen oxidase
MKRVLVVGAGLSGLATACALSDEGFDVTVVESTGRPGGLIGTMRTAQGLVERAANAFVWNDVSERWFRQLGLTPAFPRQESRRRFIFARGRARRWPLTVGETVVAGARVGAALVRRRLRPEAGESVASFTDRVGGSAVTHSLLGPALQGVYGAQPHELSATTIFGARRRRRAGLATPAHGMGTFIDALCCRLADRGVPVRFKTPIDVLDPHIRTVVCTNVSAAARLVRPYAPGLSRSMASTSMTGLVTATAFFPRHKNDLEGFGVLFPRSSGVHALGVLFNTSIFDGRGALRSETWIYSEHPGEAADVHVAPRISADRMLLTGRDSTPVAIAITRHDAALPVYGHSISAIQSRLGELPPWLRLSGNYLGQIGVTHLLERADAIAADASRSWR